MKYKTLLSLSVALVMASAAQAQVAKSYIVDPGPGGIASDALLGGAADPDGADRVVKDYYFNKKPATTLIPGDLSLDTNGAAKPIANAAPNYSLGFEGVSQYDGALFGRNFIPPDTNGAVGLTQYMEVSNGAYAVFDKYTGVRTSLVADTTFWLAAGQTGANGDSRIMYNADASRWIAISFGANTKDIQIAISDSDNALGPWKSTKFQGYAGFGFGATADYPTLALDKNAVYIGTNDFAPKTAGGANNLRGTTLNVIPLNSLFGGAAPTTANMKQFVTTLTATSPDNGFAIQGVNSSTAGGTGTILANSMFFNDEVIYKVNGLTSSSALGAVQSLSAYINETNFTDAGAGRQPSAGVGANQRIIATLDQRISSSVYEANGKIYMVHTVDDTTDGRDEARVRWVVIDKATQVILAQGNIGDAGYDYYQGSIAVNEFGEVMIGYNRSGLDPTTGKISFMARAFSTLAGGGLMQMGDEFLLKESLTDDYHNGSAFGNASVGRQRWGDYSQVSIDPSNHHNFYLIGEFAREYNNAAGGHPGGTGGSRWGTWIAAISVPGGAVPEPSTWAMMILGFGLAGVAVRRRRTVNA